MSSTRPISLFASVHPGASTCHDRTGRKAGFLAAEAGWAAVTRDAATAAVRAAHRMSGVRDGEGKTPGTVQILAVGCCRSPTSLTEFSSRPRDLNSAIMTSPLPQALVDDYRRDGAVCVRGAFSPEEIELVAEGIERNLADPSPRGIVASRDDDAGRFFED